MALQVDWFGLIAIIGISQGLITGFILWFRPSYKGRPERYLGLLQICGSLALILSLLSTTNFFLLFPWLLGISYPFFYLMGSGMYLYVLSLTDKEFSIKKNIGWMIPGPILGTLGTIPLLRFPLTRKLAIIENTLANLNFSLYEWLLFGGALLYIWIMIFFSYKKIHSYRKRIQEEYSNTQEIDLHPLTRLFWFAVICWAGITLISLFNIHHFGRAWNIKFSALFPVIYLVISGYNGLFALYKSKPQPKKNQQQNTATDLSEKFRWLEEEMITKRYYLEPDLSLPDLADRIRFYRNELSMVINQEAGKSFYHYINQFRVNYFIEQLKKETVPSQTILDLALQSGFNSKAAFYSAFKGITGKTPKQYINSRSSD